jgi:pyruvate dehydrogenase E2 component (dihydrolipoamide acetyltransferase)
MPEIVMPKLSDTMTEGTLVAWRKKIGDKVTAGDVLAEIETDKATMEWEAVEDGTLAAIYIREGGKVDVGEAIAFVQAKGESVPERKAAAAPSAAPAAPAPAPKPSPAATAAPAPEKRAARTPAPASGDRIKASPLAKKVADELGVALSQVEGTGPGGRITQDDVLAAAGKAPAHPTRAAPAPAPAPSRPSAAAPAPARAAAPPPKPVPAIAPGAGDIRTPLSGMRRVIAERLLLSKTSIPHFYLFAEIDAGELMKLRAEINAASERAGHGKFTVNDFVLKACIMAAMRVPQVNASFDGDAVIQYGGIHFAVAVAVGDGLVTPVIREAGAKTLRELSDTVKDLAARARGKKLKPEEYQGGTITLSNLGAYGVESFAAIINPPQSLIVSIGAIVKKPAVNDRDEIVVGHRMSVGLSCDHRVVDGAVGARYLGELRQLLENPTLMLV